VHRRLIDKVYLTEKCRIACGRVVEGREIAKEWHAGRAMLLGKRTYRDRKFIDRIGGGRDLLTIDQIDIRNMRHLIVLLNGNELSKGGPKMASTKQLKLVHKVNVEGPCLRFGH
jgi:hypothetical protein